MRIFILIALASTCIAASAHPQPVVVGSAYFADKPFPEFMPLWQEGWSLKGPDGNKLIYARPDMPLGGYMFVYLRNSGLDRLEIEDLTIQGVKLSEGIGLTGYPESPEEKYGASILLSKLPKERTDLLKQAGWPMWWKPERRVIPAGAMGEVVIRMKRAPAIPKISVGIVTNQGTISTIVEADRIQPRFATISFSTDLQTIYLYAKHPNAGMKPAKVFLNGRDVTASCDIASDKVTDLSPIVLRLSSPLEWMSYQSFKAAYPDGSAAMAGIRAWGHEMVYGMWGGSLEGGSAEEIGKKYLTDWATHNINCHMGHSTGPGRDFYVTEEGWQFCKSLGMGRMTTWDVGPYDPTFFFVQDEPDANDAGTGELEPWDRLGSLGLWCVRWCEALRKHDSNVPLLLNIDNTYKPENWYMYHQLADIPCVDPYYPEQLDQTYWNHPGTLSVHSKPTYVSGVTAISQSSGQPKPLHVILCSTRYQNEALGQRGRFPTPEEKRMEVYYSIGNGAKGLSYWWFAPDTNCVGIGKDEPEAHALWKEIGLLGAEVRTAGRVITQSCPANLPVKSPKELWTRTLLSGTDTVALIVVNDDVACDRVGTVYKPVEQAQVTVEIPGWITPMDAFEVTYEGIKDLPWKRDGSKVAVSLDKVNISRFVLITSDASLRNRLQMEYDGKYALNVKKILGGQ